MPKSSIAPPIKKKDATKNGLHNKAIFWRTSVGALTVGISAGNKPTGA